MEDRSIKSNYNNSLVDTQYKKRGFPDSSAVKNPHANAGDAGDSGSAPWEGRSPGGGHGNPFQYFCWEIPWTEEPGGLWLETKSAKSQKQL